MRLLVGLILVILLGCALAVSNEHKPFELRIQ